MKQSSRRQRAKSFYFNLRRFHNWIKRELINKAFAERSREANGIFRLLDLSSGKGGDLQKWVDAGIKYIEGYDIHEPSVIEARRRFNELQKRGDLSMYVSFNTMDLSKTVLSPPAHLFDVVTCMFALHYFFQSESTFNTFIQSVLNNIKPGGYFVCCLFDGQRLLDKLKSGSFLTHNFQLTLKSELNPSPFGNKIGVLMRETVLDKETDEYIVQPEQFRNLMKAKGFELKTSMAFDQIYTKWIQEKNPPLNVFEQEVSFLNRYYVFQRVN